MSLHLKILGCGGNIGFKYQSTCFMSWVGEKTKDTDLLLIDGGTGITKVKPEEIKNIKDIALTHSHLDHTCGLALLVEAFFDDDCKQIVRPRLHTSQMCLDTMKQTTFAKNVWMDLIEREFMTFEDIEDGETHTLENGITIQAVRVKHANMTLGYVVKYGESAFVFAGDTTYCESFWKTISQIKEVKAVLCEVSLNNDLRERADASCHMTPEYLQKGISFLNKDIKIYATHIKGYSYKKVIEELKHLDRPIEILEDDMELIF